MTLAAEEPGEILNRDAQGRVLLSRERRELLLKAIRPERDERSKIRRVHWNQIRNAGLLAAVDSHQSPRSRHFLRCP